MQARYGKNQDAIFLHSEIDAIKNAIRNISLDQLTRSTLYVARLKRDTDAKTHIQGLACPCDGCAKAIAAFNIKRVVYTLDTAGLSCID